MLSFYSTFVSAEQVAILNPLEKETIIFELEALALYAGRTILLQAAAIKPSDRIVLFLDNDAVLGRVETRAGLAWMAKSSKVSWNGSRQLARLRGTRESHLLQMLQMIHPEESCLVLILACA